MDRVCDQSGGTDAVDRISDLPDDIIQKILSFLKVDESVPTSILSKRWRYQWTFNSDLHFRDACNLKTVRACIMQNQSKELHGFHLKYRWNNHSHDYVPEMEELLDMIIRKKIRNLTLETLNIFATLSFTVPSSLFSSHTLESLKLELNGCVVELPTDINCFESLVHLSLNFVRFNREFASIISGFRLLQTLVLHMVKGELCEISISLPVLQKFSLFLLDCHTLEIHAPNLQDLYVVGDFIRHCTLERAPYLRTVCFLNETFNALESFIQNIATVETLCIRNFDLKQYIENNSNGPRLIMKILRKIELEECCSGSYSHLTCFFQDCPLLEEINLAAYVARRSQCKNWEEGLQDEDAKLASEFVDKSLERLKMVNMKNFTGDPKEMALIKLLLREAKVLQTVQLHIHLERFTQDYVDWLLERMNMFPKISARATIEPYFYINGMEIIQPPVV